MRAREIVVIVGGDLIAERIDDAQLRIDRRAEALRADFEHQRLSRFHVEREPVRLAVARNAVDGNRRMDLIAAGVDGSRDRSAASRDWSGRPV